jgi:hypothetical protein
MDRAFARGLFSICQVTSSGEISVEATLQTGLYQGCQKNCVHCFIGIVRYELGNTGQFPVNGSLTANLSPDFRSRSSQNSAGGSLILLFRSLSYDTLHPNPITRDNTNRPVIAKIGIHKRLLHYVTRDGVAAFCET